MTSAWNTFSKQDEGIWGKEKQIETDNARLPALHHFPRTASEKQKDIQMWCGLTNHILIFRYFPPE